MTDYRQHLTDDGFSIFLFHGVIRAHRHPVRNYTRKHIDLSRFVRIVRDLRDAGTAVSMADVVEATAARRPLPPRAFVISFDDGFENNLSVAAPALDDLQVPAIFYVTTQFLAENSGSWTDRIEYAVQETPVCALELPCARGRFSTTAEKIDLLNRIRAHVKATPSVDPYAFADEVWHQLGVRDQIPDPDLDQKLSFSDVRTLARHPLFIVGGHGHTHRILSFLPPAELEREISLSLTLLRPHLPPGPLHYSYPEGLHHCYSDAVIEALRRHDVVCAPTAEPGANHVGDDLYRLRRFMVGD